MRMHHAEVLMKMVDVRVSASIPEALSKPMSIEPTEKEWKQFQEALLQWAGYMPQGKHYEECDEPAVVWATVAFRVAYETLPIFQTWRRELKKTKGGRPAKDGATGYFGLGNPHRELMNAVDGQLAKDKAAGKRRSVPKACDALAAGAAKQLLPRYHNLTGGRLKRLYYDGKTHDERRKEETDQLRRGLERYLSNLTKS
jgi:hypothetical protein